MRVGALVCGNLGLKSLTRLFNLVEVIFVMTDINSTEIIENCRQKKIPFFIGNPRNERSVKFIEDKSIEVLISVNYLYIIEQNLIDLPQKMAFNIHGSLLPKYRGRTPHVWAIINDEKETGVTAHFIDQGCDTGDIIQQIRIPISSEDTGGAILDKFNKIYLLLLEEVLWKIESNSIVSWRQKHSEATYFGKRTPIDGKIDWSWQKRRIKNWVRAQADPYPGAFTYYEQQKIIIDEIQYDERGYEYDMPNGLILSDTPLLVKTANGVVRIAKYRSLIDTFIKGKIFN